MKSLIKKHFVFFLLLSVILVACNKCSKEPTIPIVLLEPPEKINEEVDNLLEKQLSNLDTNDIVVSEKDSLVASKFVLAVFKNKNYKHIWTDTANLLPQADSLLSVLEFADVNGLIAENYHYDKIKTLLRTKKDSVTKKYDAVKIYSLNLLLTDAFFKYVVHLNKGRLNVDSLTAEWHPEKLDTNLIDVFNYAFENNKIKEVISSFEPQNKQYQFLKLALKNFKYEFKDTDWDSLASRESDSITFKERLKQRLIKSHDYFDEYSGNDSIKLLKAVKNFQCRHYLTEDGKIGKLTFKALQRTKQDYIKDIELNMERWRLYEEPKEKRYVWVNIPKYEMQVVEDDTIVMKSRVITGAPKTQTPLLKSSIGYFIIYPYWTVPFSIIVKETLPILKRDTSYLRRKNFEVLDGNNKVLDASKINWKKYSKNYFPFKIRQRIGNENSLGILKFNFHNKYGVYMHDTDNRKLFNREMRALSHGCVRLEKFVDFAKFLIREDTLKYPYDSLIADLDKPKQKYVYVKKPPAVYINYFTAESNEMSALYFFIDVYRRDEKMRKALYKK